MNSADIAALSPLLALAGTAVVVMLAAAFPSQPPLGRNTDPRRFLAASGAALAIAWPETPRQITPLLMMTAMRFFSWV